MVAELDPNTPTDADFIPRASLATPTQLFNDIKMFAYGNQNRTDDPGYPVQPCTIQAPQSSIGESSESTNYLHVYQDNPEIYRLRLSWLEGGLPP